MTAREYIKTLNPENSYWEIHRGTLERLNEVPPTAENLYMVFECKRCSSYHAVPYTNLKNDTEWGGYDVFCGDEYEDFVHDSAIPKELWEIFKNTKFEEYAEGEDDDYDADDAESD